MVVVFALPVYVLATTFPHLRATLDVDCYMGIAPILVSDERHVHPSRF